MGSLSNLYISQSYISLIHLGSNNTASSTPTELQDGLGNGVGVSVSTNKNLYVSGNVYATNLTGSVIDSSSFITTASFNAYTQSTNTFTASISTSVGLLQTFSASSDSRYVQNSQTSSMAVSSSLYSVTASYAVFAQTASEARNLIVIARNGNQSTLSAGTVVHITSAVGDNPIFNTASFDTELLSANTLGILRSTLSSGGDGEVVVNGIVTGVNTDPTLGYVAGDVVYLSASGQFTRVQPQAPNQIVVLGQVLRAQQNNGSLYVSINNGWELNELHNVQINTPLTNDLLAYESSSYGLWKNKSFSSLGLATTSSVNDLSASIYQTDVTQSINIASNSSSIGLLQTFSGSQYKADSASFDTRINSAGGTSQVQEEGSILGDVTSFNFIGAGVTASVSAGTASITIPGGGASIDTGSFATTGSNTFTGNQTIEGAIVSNPTTSLTKLFSQAFVSGAVQLNITASNATSQSNLVLIGGPLLASATQTGSVIISGSNNILLNPVRNNTLATNFSNGYIGGNNNIIVTIPTLHTQSLVNPTMNSNNINSLLSLNFITSSTLAVPVISNNQILGITTITHPSGSVSFQGNIVMGNSIQSTANVTPLTLNSTIAQNVVAGLSAISLNHNSSSITYNGNIGGGMTVTNNYSSSVSTAVNNITVNANTFGGTSHTLLVSGSNTANRRTFSNNIVVGSTNAISSDLIGSTGGHLIATAVIGQNLIVSASGTSTTVGGGAYFGRYNDINAGLADSGKTIFAVGTGTGTSARKTALSIDSSSVVNISGSLTVTSSVLNIDGSGNVTASTILVTNSGESAIQYSFPSTGSVLGQFATSYGKDNLKVYQYQGQPYAFNVLLTANQANAYTGSEFNWGLQLNGSSVSLPGGGGTYFSMVSGSTTGSGGGGADKKGLEFLETAMILDMRADTSFQRKVYVDKGMFVSQSVGGGKPSLIVDGTNASNNRAIVATGSVSITGDTNIGGVTTLQNILQLPQIATLSTGSLGQVAVSGSNIYFHNGTAWKEIFLVI